MWRGLFVGLPLSGAQIPVGDSDDSIVDIQNQHVCGEDAQVLLQARMQPRSSRATKFDPSALLESVRSVALTIKSQSPETVTALVASIRATIEDMKPLLQAEHNEAQGELSDRFAEIGACADRHSLTGAVEDLANQAGSLEACAAARSTAATTRDGLCGSWTDHADRTYRDFPTCLSGSPTHSEILAKMQSWQSFLNGALSGMESRNTACDDAATRYDAEDSRCLETETQFDGAFCLHQEKCTLLHGCHGHEVSVYTDLIAHTETAMTARQAQFRTIEQVDCLLGVIATAMEGNLTISEDDMDSCNGNAAVDDLVLSVPTPEFLQACPSRDDNDPACPAVQMPPLWSGGEADGHSAGGTGEWTLVLQYADMPWQQTVDAIGTVSESEPGIAKLSDQDINAVEDDDETYDYYLLTSDAIDLEVTRESILIRTTGTYDDSRIDLGLYPVQLCTPYPNGDNIADCTEWVIHERHQGAYQYFLAVPHSGDDNAYLQNSDCRTWWTGDHRDLCPAGREPGESGHRRRRGYSARIGDQVSIRNHHCFAHGTNCEGFPSNIRRNVKMYKWTGGIPPNQVDATSVWPAYMDRDDFTDRRGLGFTSS